MTFLRVLIAACLVTALPGPAALRAAGPGQTPPVAAAIPSDAFDLASAALQTLSRAAYARSRLTVANSQGLLEVMGNTRLAISRLDLARQQVRLSRESADRAVQTAAAALESSLDALINPLVTRVRTMEKLLEPDTQSTEWAALTAQVTTLNARLAEAWALLPASIVAVTQALVDQTRTLDGSLAYMKLTRQQHDTVSAELVRLFPSVTDEAGGNHPVIRVREGLAGICHIRLACRR